MSLHWGQIWLFEFLILRIGLFCLSIHVVVVIAFIVFPLLVISLCVLMLNELKYAKH